MKRLCGALVLLLLAGPAPAEIGLPTGSGLPIRVKAAVTFVEIESFSENNATFKATVDVRLRWQVLSLRRPAAEAADPPRVFRAPRRRHNWRRSGCRPSNSPISAATRATRRSDCASIPMARSS